MGYPSDEIDDEYNVDALNRALNAGFSPEETEKRAIQHNFADVIRRVMKGEEVSVDVRKEFNLKVPLIGAYERVPLKVESLEATLKNVTFDDKHLKLHNQMCGYGKQKK